MFASAASEIQHVANRYQTHAQQEITKVPGKLSIQMNTHWNMHCHVISILLPGFPGNRRRMTTPLVPIAALSDEESVNGVTASRPKQSHRNHLRRPARGRIVKSARGNCGPNDNPKALANLVKGKCGCKADCFSQFRYHDPRFDQWLAERKKMSKMEKLEKDDYVRDLQLCHFVRP